MDNEIVIIRKFEGHHVTAKATYKPAADGWLCAVACSSCGFSESRGPVNDAWAELQDMIDLALDVARSHQAMIDGPFSDAACRR